MGISAQVVQADAAKVELARRELARRRFVDYECYVAPYYRPARHHRLVAEYLELVETYIRTKGATGIGRLLILEPPRHGKSEQATKHFPSWVLGRLPDTRVIITSYGFDLAQDFSRAVRDIVAGERYRNLFGSHSTVDAEVELSSDSRSVRAWDLAAPNRGGVVAAGVGGGITGKGAHLFIIDDPFKNREEAESEPRRESIWQWWTSTAYTRLEDGAAVVAMLTRWHGDDWAGRILKLMATDPLADRWVMLCLPAIWEEPEIPEGKTFDELQREKMLEGVWLDKEDPLGRKPGEALWPEKYSADELAIKRRNMGDYDFQALYQQWPFNRSGSMFKREWFTVVDLPPKPEDVVMRIRMWDKAGSQSGDGDYAVGVLMSWTKDELVYVEDVARLQGTPGERDELIKSTAEIDLTRKGPRVRTMHQQDPGTAGVDSAQAANRMLAKIGMKTEFETLSGDKEVRAGPWSSALQGGGVRLVRAAWNAAYIDEHIAFPKGRYDDQVDASSTGYSKLTGHTPRESRIL